jgi:nitrate/nitrite-specific signal transduction histidine kinase
VTIDLAEDVLVVARKALTNVAKHANSAHTELTLAVRDGVELRRSGHSIDLARADDDGPSMSVGARS